MRSHNVTWFSKYSATIVDSIRNIDYITRMAIKTNHIVNKQIYLKFKNGFFFSQKTVVMTHFSYFFLNALECHSSMCVVYGCYGKIFWKMVIENVSCAQFIYSKWKNILPRFIFIKFDVLFRHILWQWPNKETWEFTLTKLGNTSLVSEKWG